MRGVSPRACEAWTSRDPPPRNSSRRPICIWIIQRAQADTAETSVGVLSWECCSRLGMMQRLHGNQEPDFNRRNAATRWKGNFPNTGFPPAKATMWLERGPPHLLIDLRHESATRTKSAWLAVVRVLGCNKAVLAAVTVREVTRESQNEEI